MSRAETGTVTSLLPHPREQYRVTYGAEDVVHEEIAALALTVQDAISAVGQLVLDEDIPAGGATLTRLFTTRSRAVHWDYTLYNPLRDPASLAECSVLQDTAVVHITEAAFSEDPEGQGMRTLTVQFCENVLDAAGYVKGYENPMTRREWPKDRRIARGPVTAIGISVPNSQPLLGFLNRDSSAQSADVRLRIEATSPNRFGDVRQVGQSTNLPGYILERALLAQHGIQTTILGQTRSQ